MSAKKLITAVLLAFVALNVVVLVVQEIQGGRSTPGAGETGPENGVIAYYFHATKRCVSCRKIEAFAHEAIQQGFADAVRDGRLEWRVADYEAPGNKHFVDDYDIAASTVVIVQMREGRQARAKNLEEVWDYLDDKDAFVRFIQKEVGAFLGEG